MGKERLSKLQKWILKRIEEKNSIKQSNTLFKSIKNMISKRLIKEGEFKNYILTEKGFYSLKDSVSLYDMKYSNFKDYLSSLENSDKDFKAYQKGIKNLLGVWKRRKGA